MTAERIEMIRLESMDRYGFGPKVMKNIKVCAHCGEPSEASETVCRYCGSSLPEETLFQVYRAKHAYCSCCDTVIPKWMQYCPQCGKRLHTGIIRNFLSKNTT